MSKIESEALGSGFWVARGRQEKQIENKKF